MHIQEINVKNQFYNYYFDNLVNAEELETKVTSIDGISYRDLVIYFTGFAYRN